MYLYSKVQRYFWGGGPTPRGGPNNTKSAFLTHRTTHSAKIFGRETPEYCAEGAILENFTDFSENLFLKNEIKRKNLGVWGQKNFPESDFGKYCRKVFRKVFFRQNYVLKLQ